MAIEYLSDNKCRLVVYNGTDLKGKPKRYRRTVTYTSKRNAEKQYREFEREVLDSKVNVGNITVEEILTLAINHSKRNGARLSTVRGYEKQKDRILKTLGNPRAKSVKSRDVESWIDKLYAVPYSAKTIRDTLSLLSRGYNRAIQTGSLDYNPCDSVILPKSDRSKKRRTALDENTLKPYLKALNEENDLDVAMVIKLALFLGMRRSEILGLKESSIDFENKLLVVEAGRHLIDGKADVTAPKSSASHRAIALNDTLLDDIRELIEYHNAQLVHSPYLIHSALGEAPSPDSVTAWVRSFAKRHNVQYITLHGLRHSCATLMVHNGQSIAEVSSNLGHAQISTTADIYTHLFVTASTSSRKSADNFEKMYKDMLD